MLGIGYWWGLQKFKCEQRKIKKRLQAQMTQLKKEGLLEERLVEIMREYNEESVLIDERIRNLRDDKIVSLADRYALPIPPWEEWEPTKTGWRCLRKEDFVKIRAAIREEQKACREQVLAWIPLATALTGIGGVIVAILALLKK
jgi:hypothetical protein